MPASPSTERWRKQHHSAAPRPLSWHSPKPWRCVATRSRRAIAAARLSFTRVCAGRRLFWLHNRAAYLKKPRNLWRLARDRPTLVVTGAYHAATIPRWLPCGRREIIPYGVLDRFRTASPREPPVPRAIFTSNPLRGLDWLLDLWVARIKPAVPQSELHIYAGGAVYALAGTPRARRMEETLAGDGATGGAGHALPRRSRRTLLLGARRSAGDGGTGRGQAAGLDCRAGRRRG